MPDTATTIRAERLTKLDVDLIRPTRGRIEVFGADPSRDAALRRRPPDPERRTTPCQPHP